MKYFDIANPFSTGPPSEWDIDRAIGMLKSAPEAKAAVATLVGYGRAAVAPLKQFLFQNHPSADGEPRCRAVEALGALHAKDVLIDYLKRKRNHVDPTIGAAEQEVENAAARVLAAFRTADVFEFLGELALPQLRTGLVEALGQFAAAEAIPFFIRALGEETCCAQAGEALRRLGPKTEAALRCAALTPVPSAEAEWSSSLRRRIRALDLLLEINASKETWSLLRTLLMDSDQHVVTAASRLAARLGSREDRLTAVARLLKIPLRGDWFLQGEIQNCLVGLHPDAKELVDEEIARRLGSPQSQRGSDPLLRMLLRVRRQVEPGPVPVEDSRV